MNWKSVLGAGFLALCSTAWGGPEDKISGNDIFTNPKKEIEFGKLKYLSKSDTIIVPFVTVKLQNWGTQGAVEQTGGLFRNNSATQTAQARATVTIDVAPETAQALATGIHADLVKRLRDAGWNVLTFDDIKDSKAFQKLKWEDAGELGAGITSEKADGKVLGIGAADGGGAGYYIAVPAGQELLKYGITGPAWAMKKVAKELDANIFTPTYVINTVDFNPETAKGFEWQTSATGAGMADTASASVGVFPVVSLASVNAPYLNPKQAGSLLGLKTDGYGRHGNVASGKIVSSKDTSPKAANALGSAFRALGGAGIQSSKTEYVIEPDNTALTEQAMALAGAYNDVIARAMTLYKGK